MRSIIKVLRVNFQVYFKNRAQLLSFISTMKEDVGPEYEKYYRCRPSLYESLPVGPYLLDMDGTHLFIYHLEDLTLQKSIEVITKEDIFTTKIRAINDTHVIIFGMYSFWVISLSSLTIIQTKLEALPSMIEYAETSKNYLSILTSDEEGENKLLYFWKFGKDGKIQQSFQPFEVTFPEFEDCTEDRLEMTIIESIDYNPKVYLYWKGTNNMVELDPSRKLQERYSRVKDIYYLTDIDNTHYCEISANKINICSKKGGKDIGSFSHQKEEYRKIIVKNTEPKEYFSISDQGVKGWKLQNNTEPLFYAESDKYPVENLYLNHKEELVGVNVEKKYILIWKNDKEVTIHNFPNEIIRKIMKVNDTQICLLLEATMSKEVQNEFQVEKYNKMEIFDLEKNKAIAKKAVQKLQYKIDIDSAIVGLDSSIIFLLNEVTALDSKKYIFKWSPFSEDKKKESKKREIVEAAKYHSIKLYPFERIVTFKKSKDAEMYDLFGKAIQVKSQVTLFDFNAKKIGDYQISGDVKQIELSQEGQIYALGKDKFSIYEINTDHKNRLEKIHELQVAVTFIYPLENHIIMKKEGAILVYDKEFDLVMKEEEDQELTNYKVLRVSDKKFILANEQEISLWDLDKEDKIHLSLTKEVSPALVELMSEKSLLVADKWIESYDFYELIK